MLKDKRAFTLAEVLITLAVMSILAAILLPAIAKIRPDKSKMMFKKAYYVAERMVFELVNDEELYPSTGSTDGLDNTATVTYLEVEYTGVTKFCELFARKVNLTSEADDINCESSHAVPSGGGTYTTPTFITTDGVAWYLPVSNFSSTQTIYIDINGEKNPNCQYNSSTCTTPDIFAINVEPDGKMYVDGDFEKEYLQSNSSMQ